MYFNNFYRFGPWVSGGGGGGVQPFFHNYNTYTPQYIETSFFKCESPCSASCTDPGDGSTVCGCYCPVCSPQQLYYDTGIHDFNYNPYQQQNYSNNKSIYPGPGDACVLDKPCCCLYTKPFAQSYRQCVDPLSPCPEPEMGYTVQRFSVPDCDYCK
ncbi:MULTISPECIES: hypothetical protein [Bacillus cereus group]|uniref:hypothetical protein n=1 Tax=Bacillus cereus group TaxID=86661 RepID=UPI000BF7C9E1|nr:MULTISPECIES: hypothetical protein [Bacillus cereus group]PER69596.1 hypothetical protein CN502_09765 [Bacillus cereus]PFT09270.1 hypothetical protein COK59_09210 [Bacillus thuringiensis]PGL36027.1 hypothetical protein CN913_20490 [Bacillus cereus]